MSDNPKAGPKVDDPAATMSVTRTLAFVDLAGFTALTEQHGDDLAADSAERFYRLAQESLLGRARIVKTIGDAVMLAAPTVSEAVATVFALTRAVVAEPSFLGFRAGLHCGTVVERAGDYFGSVVNVASRITAHADIGQVLASETVAEEARHFNGIRVSSLGEVTLKNLSAPITLFRLQASMTAEEGSEFDPVCRMRTATPYARWAYGGRTWAFCSEACLERFRRSPGSFTGGQPGEV